jgi:hypothetical protein
MFSGKTDSVKSSTSPLAGVCLVRGIHRRPLEPIETLRLNGGAQRAVSLKISIERFAAACPDFHLTDVAAENGNTGGSVSAKPGHRPSSAYNQSGVLACARTKSACKDPRLIVDDTIWPSAEDAGGLMSTCLEVKASRELELSRCIGGSGNRTETR